VGFFLTPSRTPFSLPLAVCKCPCGQEVHNLLLNSLAAAARSQFSLSSKRLGVAWSWRRIGLSVLPVVERMAHWDKLLCSGGQQVAP